MEKGINGGFSFLIPAYNEEQGLAGNIRTLHQYLLSKDISFEIIICNDGSIDDTSAIAEKLSDEIEDVRSIGYSINRGRGYAIKFSEKYLRGDYLIYLDSDIPSSIDLSYIDQMIQYLISYDVVVASRFHKEAKIKRKWHRFFISKVYQFLVKIVFSQFGITDPDVGFKGIRRNVFSKVIPYTDLNGWSWDLQFLINASNLGYSCTEFPFDWVEKYETTSVNIFRDSFYEFIGLLYIKYGTIRHSIKKLTIQESTIYNKN